jgi:hypothetical protein
MKHRVTTLSVLAVVMLFVMNGMCTVSPTLQKEIADIPLEANAAFAVLTITKTIPASDLPIAIGINNCISTQGPAVLAELDSTGTGFQKGITVTNYLESCAAQAKLLSPTAQAIYAVVFSLIEQIGGEMPAGTPTISATETAYANSLFGKAAKAKHVKVDTKKLEAAYGKPAKSITPADVAAKFKALAK